MLVRPVDFNGMIQNTTQVQNEKTSEDSKPLIQQNVITEQANKQETAKATTVQANNRSEKEEFNPEEGGDGTGYGGNYGRKEGKQKTKKVVSEGRMIKKGQPKPFDIKI